MSQYLCPECSVDSNVIDARPYYNRMRRRRKCKKHHKFSTIEVPADTPEQIVNLVQWLIEEQASLEDALIPYLRSQVREIMLGLTEEEAV